MGMLLPYHWMNKCVLCSLPWKILDGHFARHWWKNHPRKPPG